MSALDAFRRAVDREKQVIDERYQAGQRLAQMLLLANGVNPDSPVTDEFPKQYQVDGYMVRIDTNDEPGEYDVDCWVAAILPPAAEVVG